MTFRSKIITDFGVAMPTSSISKINEDCLLSIIDDLIGQMPDSYGVPNRSNRPLDFVRATSQVCRTWRQVIIGSPWIWGRVVDLDMWGVYHLGRSKWMEEVVKRAGSAPLWIYGAVWKPKEGSGLFNTQAFFCQVLASWERIERLSVVVHDEKIPDNIQSRFLTRAPILKVFEVKTTHTPIGQYFFLKTLQPWCSPEKRLFANHAPCLQAMKADKVAFNLDSPWLSGIREMELSWATLKEVFIILQQTPILERVVISNPTQRHIRSNSKAHWPRPLQPNLPRLSTIRLTIGLEDAAMLLHYLAHCKPSDFWLHVADFDTQSASGHIVSSFQKNLPFYISRYFASKKPINVNLRVMAKNFTFIDVTERSGDNVSHFGISVYHSMFSPDERDGFMACLLGTFVQASTCLSPNTKSHLFETINQITLDFKLTQCQILSNLYAMLAVFDHVTIIRIDEHSGDILYAIVNQNDKADGDHLHVLFPRLHSLYLISDPGPFITNTTYSDLTKFLSHRAKMGFPVAKLDLTTCGKSRYAQDLSALEEVGGLEVVWTRQETTCGSGGYPKTCRYICGSGEPQRLTGLCDKYL